MTSTLDSKVAQMRQECGGHRPQAKSSFTYRLDVVKNTQEDFVTVTYSFLRFHNKCWHTRLPPGPCPLGIAWLSFQSGPSTFLFPEREDSGPGRGQNWRQYT